MELSGPEWEQWAGQEQTKEFLKFLEETVKQAQVDWLNRRYEDESPHKWAVLNAAALAVAGFAEELRNVIENIGKNDHAK